MTESLVKVFDALREVMWTHGHGLDVKVDAPTRLSIDVPLAHAKAKPRFFGAVEVKKAYVSYHLMPVYDAPALLADIPPGLKARMHGKSCFNFTAVDAVLLAALGDLTRAGYDQYAAEGLVPGRQEG